MSKSKSPSICVYARTKRSKNAQPREASRTPDELTAFSRTANTIYPIKNVFDLLNESERRVYGALIFPVRADTLAPFGVLRIDLPQPEQKFLRRMASYKEIHTETGLSERDVQRAISSLVQKEFVMLAGNHDSKLRKSKKYDLRGTFDLELLFRSLGWRQWFRVGKNHFPVEKSLETNRETLPPNSEEPDLKVEVPESNLRQEEAGRNDWCQSPDVDIVRSVSSGNDRGPAIGNSGDGSQNEVDADQSHDRNEPAPALEPTEKT
jgi:hypothetical protein